MKKRTIALLGVAAWVCLLPCGPVWANAGSQVMYARGLVPFHRGFWEQAYLLFDEAVRADRDDAAALYYRGLTQARRGSRAAAIKDIERALQLDPGLTHAALDLGVAHLDEGQYASARPWLEKAYRDGTEKLSSALFLGVALYRLEEYHSALRYLEEAKADPELRQAALYYGGLALLRIDRATQARNAFSEAARERADTDMGKLAARYAAGEEEPRLTGTGIAAALPFSLSAQTSFEYDSNVSLGANDGPSGSTSDADGRTVLGVAGRGTLLSSEVGELVARGSLSQSVHFSLREFDLTATRLRLDWYGAPGWWSYGASTGYDFNGLDYKGFYQDIVATPWVALHETDTLATQVHYGFRYRDFFRAPFDPFRDGFNNAVGVRQYVLLPDGATLLHVGYQFDAESPEDTGSDDRSLASGADDFEYLGHQIDLQLSSTLAVPNLGPFDAALGYRYRFDDYSNPNSRSRENRVPRPRGESREDNEHLFAMSLGHDLNHEVAVLRAWTQRTVLALSFIVDVNSSNIGVADIAGTGSDDVFDYDRFVGQLGLRAEF